MNTSEEKKSRKLLEKYEEVALKAIDAYSFLNDFEVQLLSYTENAVYLIKNSDGHNFVLRVCRPGYHTKPEIESEINWINSLDKHSPVEVATPIAASDGDFVQTIKFSDDKNSYHCILFTYLKGEMLSNYKDSELQKHFLNIGEITAHFHNNDQNRPDLDYINRSTWDVEAILGENPKWGKWQDGPAITPDRYELFEEVSNIIQQRLKTFGQSSDRFGLIHSDLRLDNILIDNDQYKVLDFDDCGFGWYLFDLAATFNSIDYESSASHSLQIISSDLIKSWVEGYRKVRSLSQEEEDEIPTFILMRRLMSIGWMGSRNNKKTREMGEIYTINTVDLAKEYLTLYK